MNIKFEAKSVEEKKEMIKDMGMYHISEREIIIWDEFKEEWNYVKGWGVTVIEEREVDLILEGRKL